MERFALVLGDITQSDADAIVNAANSGMTERMQSTVPIMLSLARLSSISFLRSFTMPLTPYSVSNGSLSRNS